MFFINREGVRRVDTFIGSLPRYRMEVKEEAANLKTIPFEYIMNIRENILDRSDPEKWNKEFNVFLREVYYISEIGKGKWEAYNAAI